MRPLRLAARPSAVAADSLAPLPLQPLALAGAHLYPLGEEKAEEGERGQRPVAVAVAVAVAVVARLQRCGGVMAAAAAGVAVAAVQRHACHASAPTAAGAEAAEVVEAGARLPRPAPRLAGLRVNSSLALPLLPKKPSQMVQRPQARPPLLLAAAAPQAAAAALALAFAAVAVQDVVVFAPAVAVAAAAAAAVVVVVAAAVSEATPLAKAPATRSLATLAVTAAGERCAKAAWSCPRERTLCWGGC